jgi:hypothetical protein
MKVDMTKNMAVFDPDNILGMCKGFKIGPATENKDILITVNSKQVNIKCDTISYGHVNLG